MLFMTKTAVGIIGGTALVISPACYFYHCCKSQRPKAPVRKQHDHLPGEFVASDFFKLRGGSSPTTLEAATLYAAKYFAKPGDVVAVGGSVRAGVVVGKKGAAAAVVWSRLQGKLSHGHQDLESHKKSQHQQERKSPKKRGHSEPGRGHVLTNFTTATPVEAPPRVVAEEPGWEAAQHVRQQQRQRWVQDLLKPRDGHLLDGQRLVQQQDDQEDDLQNGAHEQLPEGGVPFQPQDKWPERRIGGRRLRQLQQEDTRVDATAMYYEERQNLNPQQPRQNSGHLVAVDADQLVATDASALVTEPKDASALGAGLVGAGPVWSKLLEATASRDLCSNPPCGSGRHLHTVWADLGDEMSHVEGAVVIRRPDLAKTPGRLAPASHLDFVKTLQSYFAIFKDSLFPTRIMLDGLRHGQVQTIRRFVDAIANDNSTAAKYLSAYYVDVKMPKQAIDGYESSPTLVGMADVFVNNLGYVWNAKDYVVPKSCKSALFGPHESMVLPTNAASYEKVFVMAQHWGDGYFHFVVEDLPRITVMLDILREDPDIKIAVHAPSPKHQSRKVYMYQFMELLGMDRSRLVFVEKEIHADLAILPSSTPCGRPDTQLINMLRHTLLQAIYPSRGGSPPSLPSPSIVLIVRNSGRGLKSNDKVREALKQGFPSYDVVEFFGDGTILSQLQTFATASLIVAPHGAGLSNMVVSPLHTPVLEIGPPECSTCYLNLAMKLQHIYARHPAGAAWNKQCESKYEPSVGEITTLVRDLIQGKRQADMADPPYIFNE